jgi:peptide/nickel transport system substrate-binding protein
MNEYVQQALKGCFFDVELDVIEWNTLFTNWRLGAKTRAARGANATNVSFATMDPFFAMVRFSSVPRLSRRCRTTGVISATPSSTS